MYINRYNKELISIRSTVHISKDHSIRHIYNVCKEIIIYLFNMKYTVILAFCPLSDFIDIHTIYIPYASLNTRTFLGIPKEKPRLIPIRVPELFS